MKRKITSKRKALEFCFGIRKKKVLIKTMKSKSFDLKESPAEKGKLNKTFDFVGLYKTAAETNVKLLEKHKAGDSLNKDNNFGMKAKAETKRERSPNKKKKKFRNDSVEVTNITIDGRSLDVTLGVGRSSPVDKPSLTSTPLARGKSKASNVKSIMKNSSVNEDEGMDNYEYISKPKKRNKSVSFMLDDTEEVAVKKTKSNESLQIDKKNSDKIKAKYSKFEAKQKLKKFKKNLQAEKENKGDANMETEHFENGQNIAASNKKTKVKLDKTTLSEDAIVEPGDGSDGHNIKPDKKKKLKKIKKRMKAEDSSEPAENESNNNDLTTEQKIKKNKKKKRLEKTLTSTEATETEGEPASKFRKKDVKAELITEDLENLSIGDNAHTLTNLLDEMTVVDKDKKKKNKHRRKKEKTHKTPSVSSSETADLEKIEEGKEKVKWKKRKWNKDKKGDADDNRLNTSVIVENLPLKIMVCYKKQLADHFEKFGLIKKIGIAEVYPTEDPKPVFTTTIIFYSEDAANKALEEDNTVFEGSRVRVKAPLPPTQTTLVVRSYAELTEQGLSSVFSGAGRIRSIRHLVKGRKSMATAFIEFDGPQSVGRAIKMAEDAKIGGKKIHVSKYEQRGSKSKHQKTKNIDTDNEGDSEDAND